MEHKTKLVIPNSPFLWGSSPEFVKNRIFGDFPAGSMADFVFPRQGAQVQFLVGELDPTCHSYDLVQPNKNFFKFKRNDLAKKFIFKNIEGFPGGPAVKNPPAIAGDPGLIPGPGRFHMLQSN